MEKTYLTRYLHGQATLGEWEGGAKGIRNISLQMTLNGSAIIRSESKTKAISHLHISHNAPYLPPPPPPSKGKKFWHKHCFKISLSVAVIPRGNEKQRLCKIILWGGGGGNRVHYGRCASGVDVRSPVITSGRAYRRRA